MILTEGNAEIKKDGQWCFAGEMQPNEYYSNDSEEPEFVPVGLFYETLKPFSWIFQGWPAMSERILPQDLSVELKSYFDSERLSSPGAFISWYTLQELQAIHWEGNLLRRQALVDPEYAHLFNGRDRPDYDVLPSHPKLIPIYEGMTPEIKFPPADYIKVTWYEKFDDLVVEAWWDKIKKLEDLGAPQNVRLFILIC